MKISFRGGCEPENTVAHPTRPVEHVAQLAPVNDHLYFLNSSGPQHTDEIQTAMHKLYDYYYTTNEYSRRFPKHNQSTLEFLYRHGAREAANILDYGCGNGRYGLPLLQQTQAQLTGYDISQPAINEFAAYVRGTPLANRVRLLCGGAALLDKQGPYDMILSLFGVLSHVGVRADRLRALRQMRGLIADRGCLVLTVPSIFRRRPLELLYAKLKRMSGRAPETLKEPGDIFFTRTIANENQHFFYHLYTVGGLKEELRDAGFMLRTVFPESILPEWMITRHDLLGKIDAALLPLLPASLGYGICVAADPV